MSEPFESLLLLLAEGRIDEDEARAAIDAAEEAILIDDWVLTAGLNPTLQLEIHVAEIVITCVPRQLTHLLRRTIEQPDTLGIPATTTAAISGLAARKMRSTPAAYSFACAEAYWLETLGDREAAKRTWRPYERVNDGEWTPEADTLFLEAPIGGAGSAGTEQLAEIVERGRREQRPDLVYYGLRNVALAYTGAGRLEEAQASFDEAVGLAPEHLDPTAMLVLVGDALRVAAAADDSPAIEAAVERLDELVERTPPLVGAAAVLARTARMLYAVSQPQAAFRSVSRIADCVR